MFSLGSSLSALLSVFVGLIGPIIGMIIVGLRARGRARTLGMIGFAAAIVVAIVVRIGSMLLPLVMQSAEASMAVVAGVWGLFTTALNVVVLIILALAIVAGRDQPAPPQPGVYGSRPA